MRENEISSITAAIATALSQKTTNTELFNGENTSVGANMSTSDTPDGQSSVAAVATSDGPRSHNKTTSAPTINGLKKIETIIMQAN